MSTKSGATTTSPTSAGTEIAPTSRVARTQSGGDPLRVVLHAREAGNEHLLQRRRDAAERDEHHVVGDRVDAERRGAEEAADQEVVGVAVHVVERAAGRRRSAEAAEVAQARPREASSAAARARRSRSAWSRSSDDRELLPDDRPGAVARAGER